MQILIIFSVSFLVIATAAQRKPGDCSPNVQISECSMTCFNDNYCKEKLKCCRTSCGGTTCVEPVSTRRISSAKPGNCPSPPTGPWVCSSRCTFDADCRGRKKCCKNRCGATACTIPVFDV